MNSTNVKANSTPTMKDVAREAGVALGTVSKVVNGLPVGEPYRLKVENAIKKLNYRVNIYARGMKSNKTYTIALLIPNTLDPFFSMLTHHINRLLLSKNYRMLLCTTDSDSGLEQKYLTMAEHNKVDGIIGLTYNPDLVVDENTPFVSIDRSLGPHIPCVACDNFAGGQLAAEKLYELGCRNLAFLRIGTSLTNEPNKRKAGFENGCLAHNLHYETKILEDGDSFDEFAHFLSTHIIHGKLSFDGIFCATDRVADYVIKFLQSIQINVPEEVQVIGFDGVRILGNHNLICSTIVQPVQEMARTCIDLLLQKDRAAKPSLVCLPVQYVAGGTTRD